MKYPHGVLGVAEDASQEEIRRAYLEQLKAHPPEQDGKKFQEISDAYHLLKNDLDRAKLNIFGIPQNNPDTIKMSDILAEDCGEVRRPGMDFWLKLLKTECRND